MLLVDQALSKLHMMMLIRHTKNPLNFVEWEAHLNSLVFADVSTFFLLK